MKIALTGSTLSQHTHVKAQNFAYKQLLADDCNPECVL